jgi:hypothetical protein
MGKKTVFCLWAALSCLGIILGAFRPWHGEIQRIELLLGAEIFSTDELIGFAYTPILAGLLGLVASVVAAKAALWRWLGIVATGLCSIIGVYNYWIFRHGPILSGLILTIIASLSGMAAFILYPSGKAAAVQARPDP